MIMTTMIINDINNNINNDAADADADADDDQLLLINILHD